MIAIKDNGRGMPIPIAHADQSNRQRSFIDVLTWYGATGASISQAYHERYGFLDYIGLVLSCVSESLKITTVWNGVLYTVSCSRGEITLPLREIAQTSERGTHIVFLPDSEVFSELTFSRDKLISILSQLSEKYPQVRISFEDENIG